MGILKKLLPLCAVLALALHGAADAADLKDVIKKNRGRAPEWIAEQAGVSVKEATAALVGAYQIPISADRFEEVWTRLATWENPLFITIVAGTVIEVHSKIPVGEFGQGFYNLNSMEGLSGHFQPKNIKAIYIIEEPSREGGVQRQVAFFDENGNRIFGVFVNRLASGGEHDPKTLEQFQAMKEDYRKEVMGEG